MLAFLNHLRFLPTESELKAELKRIRQGGAENDWIEVLRTAGGKSFEKQIDYIYKLMYPESHADWETLANLRNGYNTQPNWVQR